MRVRDLAVLDSRITSARDRAEADLVRDRYVRDLGACSKGDELFHMTRYREELHRMIERLEAKS